MFHIRRAGPDIRDSADTFSRSEIFVHGAEKAVFAAAINPRGANDIASRASFQYGPLACDLGTSVHVDRPRIIFDGVRRPTDGLAVEGILRAEMNDFRAHSVSRFRQRSRSLDVHGL